MKRINTSLILPMVSVLILGLGPELGQAKVLVGSDVTERFQDKAALVKVLNSYVQAFDSKDLKGIKATVSAHFIEATGGEKVWKERFVPAKRAPLLKKSQIKGLKIVDRKNNIFVRFDTTDKMPRGQWFVVKKQNEIWVIDDLINDFNPES